MDLNHGPPELQSGALPLSYVSLSLPQLGNEPSTPPWTGGIIPVDYRELLRLSAPRFVAGRVRTCALNRAWDLETHSLTTRTQRHCSLGTGFESASSFDESTTKATERLRPLGHPR